MIRNNAARKNRRSYEKNHDASSANNLEFVKKLAEKWGKELKFNRITEPSMGKSKRPCTVYHSLRRCTIHSAWSERHRENTGVPVLEIDASERPLARLLRFESRRIFREKALLDSSPTLADVKDVMSTQYEPANVRKRCFTVDDVSDTEGSIPSKRNKSCQVDELHDQDDYDEDGLHVSYISPLTTSCSSLSSVIYLDDDNDDLGNGVEETSTGQLDDACPSLNIASSVSPDCVSTSNFCNNDFISRGDTSQEGSSSYEHELIGVQFSVFATPIAEKVRKYREQYPLQFTTMDSEIWQHYRCNRQSKEVYEWKMEVRNILLNEFRPALRNEEIELFAVGSTINGCGSYNSDMDLCLCIPMADGVTYSSQRSFALKTLRRLNSIIVRTPTLRGVVRESVVIPAKVPIIKMALFPPYQELDVDLNVNNTAGIYNSHLIHYYSLLDQRFPAVCLLVKHWAINNGISDAASGTFNSYSLILLVLHYFQCGVRPAVLPNLQYLYPEKFGCTPPLAELQLFQTLQGLPLRPQNNETIGELLVGFFLYYASFDFESIAISLRDACVFPRENTRAASSIYRVFIEEPFDKNNTARCVTQPHMMGRIRRAFRLAKEAFSKFPPSLQRINVSV
ncbi:hypothetical protein KIN20_003535 [Parelaphostrongylus tenuis]|uniref:PAP-associated domain-containing protein n=1 Tax=Parelaphostrongylus tenuis TaxID=148309 RepID=A0AAD5MII7_PARTN|nr:hypothetical protein KIN20_003535 [Parelaphostrongylus tenuis]